MRLSRILPGCPRALIHRLGEEEARDHAHDCQNQRQHQRIVHRGGDRFTQEVGNLTAGYAFTADGGVHGASACAGA